MNLLFILLLLLVRAAAYLLHLQPLVHIYQLEGYKLPQFRLHFQRDRATLQWHRLWLCVAVCALEVALLCVALWKDPLPAWYPYAAPGFTTALYAAVLWLDARMHRLPQKKPLAYTRRVQRFLALFALVLVVLSLPFALVAGLYTQSFALRYAMLMLPGLLFALLPGTLFVAVHTLAAPIERAITRWYFNDGKRVLQQKPHIIRIGITGSYGKTTTKMILSSILGQKYRVFATPASINTPMGITRLLREELSDADEVLIAEMGARHEGDIAELCDLVQPQYGLITSIGAQHLETFGSMETIVRTKSELAHGLQADGALFVCGDNDALRRVYPTLPHARGMYGLQGQDLYMKAEEITADCNGLSFTLCAHDGQRIRCNSKLLGKHSVQNITGCAALAYEMGLSMAQIAQGIAQLESVEHRLQLIQAPGRTVIDDAYNSNPAGARAALEVLGLFEGRKIVITPGLVELGTAQEAENRLFGQEMAAVADIAILVAGNAPALRSGLESGGFDPAHIVQVPSLEKAMSAYQAMAATGDVLLFENDLPDHYEN